MCPQQAPGGAQEVTPRPWAPAEDGRSTPPRGADQTEPASGASQQSQPAELSAEAAAIDAIDDGPGRVWVVEAPS